MWWLVGTCVWLVVLLIVFAFFYAATQKLDD